MAGLGGWPTHCPCPLHSTHHPKSGCPTHRALCDVWVLSPPPCKPITSKLDQQPLLFPRDQGTHPLLRHSALGGWPTLTFSGAPSKLCLGGVFISSAPAPSGRFPSSPSAAPSIAIRSPPFPPRPSDSGGSCSRARLLASSPVHGPPGCGEYIAASPRISSRSTH